MIITKNNFLKRFRKDIVFRIQCEEQGIIVVQNNVFFSNGETNVAGEILLIKGIV